MKFALLAASVVIPLGLDLYLPVPEDNPITVEKVDLGRRLFFDRRLSRDESIACSSCHDPERAFSDGRPVSVGVFGRAGRRNAPTIINRGYSRSFFWDGRVDTLERQVLGPIQDPNEMDLSLAEAESRVGLSAREISRALATYVRSLLSGNSAFDRYVNGDRTALSDAARRGLQVFRGKGNCTTCHAGANLSDEKLHNTGVSWIPGETSRGNGHYADAGAGHGDFKTPTLRDVARTAPYMHDGSVTTLAEVVDFYDRGGRPNPNLDREIRPLNLTAEEKQALVAWLGALSGS